MKNTVINSIQWRARKKLFYLFLYVAGGSVHTTYKNGEPHITYNAKTNQPLIYHKPDEINVHEKYILEHGSTDTILRLIDIVAEIDQHS